MKKTFKNINSEIPHMKEFSYETPLKTVLINTNKKRDKHHKRWYYQRVKTINRKEWYT